ncbi:MAG TPA: class I SAM-dependent methyltransferase [Gemmatimonadaceae bacterium]|nr:class I SAM-dependent methyltransferase [Gemmatimonadaceae bacterium]
MLTKLLIVSNILLLAFSLVVGWKVFQVLRNRRLRQWGMLHSPIPEMPVEQFDEAFEAGPFGPTTRAEVSFIAMGSKPVVGGTSDFEGWVLAVFAKGAKLMFEIGTCAGKTTYLWARNLPPDGKVVTLTLPPDQTETYQHSSGDNREAARRATEESSFTRFLYNGTDVEHKVVQLYGDSKTFDETPYIGQCDVVFVDGSHAYSYVVSDGEKALRMVKPGGVVLWHDYTGLVPDVVRALDELSKRLPLVRLTGTTIVAHRRPVGAGVETRSATGAVAAAR